jgi:hypothetical protein
MNSLTKLVVSLLCHNNMRNLFLILLICLLSGCQSAEGKGLISWETFGVTSTGIHNEHVAEAEKNHKDDLTNQVKIAKITANICTELKYQAKKNDDQKAWERALVMELKAKAAAEEAGILSKVKWKVAPEPPFDFMAIITMILQGLGVASTGGVGWMALLNQGKKATIKQHEDKIARVTKKARRFAHSTDVDSIHDDEDLA